MVTSLTYGKPPKRKGASVAHLLAHALKAKQATARELSGYAGQVLKFQEWCESEDISFRHGMIQAMRLFRHLNKCKRSR